MINCLVAQSGGPTAVINSSFIGVLDEAIESKYFDNVYAGINGIEGVLQENLVNLSKIPYKDIEVLKYTPSSALGSCRYKLKNYLEDSFEYEKLFRILNKHNIKAFFYIGGNDSMDTVSALTEYTKLHNIDVLVLGIPKTIDNDLLETDHTPGFGSASKFIASAVLETYLDSSVYINNGIFITETMGRDTGWLASSAALAKIDGKNIVDFIYLPEAPFSCEKFLQDINRRFKEQNQVYIVASEGIKDENGNFLSDSNTAKVHDKFGHAQLGGVCNTLKSLIIEKGITSRVKTLELGVTQRASMHYASLTDIEEAYDAGREAVKCAARGIGGYMIGIRRLQNSPYKCDYILVEPSKAANHIKYFPRNWISSEGNYVTKEAVEYVQPLIQGNPSIFMENGLPKYTILKR